MKKSWIWVLVAIFVLTLDAFPAWAKDLPAGIRMEIVEVGQNDNEFTIFTYKDKGGSVAYYMGLGHEYRISEETGVEILGGSFSHVDEACLCLGTTAEEAMATLDALLKLFDKNEDDVTEFKARLATGGERLGGTTTVTCIVKKRLLAGKFLQLHFVSGKHRAHAALNKSTVKLLRKSLERDMKQHKD